VCSGGAAGDGSEPQLGPGEAVSGKLNRQAPSGAGVKLTGVVALAGAKRLGVTNEGVVGAGG
jgi:hypothetical protein